MYYKIRNSLKSDVLADLARVMNARVNTHYNGVYAVYKGLLDGNPTDYTFEQLREEAWYTTDWN